MDILEGIPPVFTQPPESIEIKRGQRFEIEVSDSAQTKPKVQWFKKGKEVFESKRIKLKSSEDIFQFTYRLEVEKTSPEDDGTYEVITGNDDGFASTTVIVYSEEKKQKPQFIEKFNDIEIDEESELTLSVKYIGYPNPQINFFRNGFTIKTSKTITQKEEKNESLLTIKNLSKTSHSGVYKCVAINSIGKCEHSAEIKVNKKQLYFIERLQDIEVQEKSKTLLVVRISSEDEDIRWHKDGEPIDENDDNIEIIKEGFYRKLLIRETHIENEGEYTCVLGRDNECSADLMVIELPPKIITELEDKSFVFGHTLNFNIVLSKGDAIVDWFKNNK